MQTAKNSQNQYGFEGTLCGTELRASRKPKLRRLATYLTDMELRQRGIEVCLAQNLIYFPDGLQPSRQLTDQRDDLFLHPLDLTPKPETDVQDASETSTSPIDSRINDLREAAIEENVTINEGSVSDARAFVLSFKSPERPTTGLVGNGNIRLLWLQGQEQVGLQFLGRGRVQYVCLREVDGETSPLMGMHSVKSIIQLLRSNKFLYLLLEQE